MSIWMFFALLFFILNVLYSIGAPHNAEESSTSRPCNNREKSKHGMINTQDSVILDQNFENRMLRARTERFCVDKVSIEGQTITYMHSEESGNTYKVTLKSCTCPDFISRQQPCKHMIHLAFLTNNYKQYERECPTHRPISNDGSIIPFYPYYYSAKPTGIGYCNLYCYEVSGRVIGVSNKTGRPTNHGKTICVHAHDESDAKTAAVEAGLTSLTSIKLIDVPPSYNQYSYLRGVGIPYPVLMSDNDVSALLTRYQEQNDSICPLGLFNLATQLRISVSFFATAEMVASNIWYGVSDSIKPAIFCYAVYCKATGYDFGDAMLPFSFSVFGDFTPTEKQLKYILSYEEFGYRVNQLSTRSSAYNAALGYLATHLPSGYKI